MSRQSRRDTAPELALRRILHAGGLRYRVAHPVPGLLRRSIDVAFTRHRLAVMVHGCFWHGCALHGTAPKANHEWWRQKIDRNIQRDEETRLHLEGLGWRVIVIWEHDDPVVAATEIARVLAGGLETRGRMLP